MRRIRSEQTPRVKATNSDVKGKTEFQKEEGILEEKDSKLTLNNSPNSHKLETSYYFLRKFMKRRRIQFNII